MTDELDRLRKTPPAPRSEARDAAMQAGLAAFDAEAARETKGSAGAGRLMNVRHFIRRLSMPGFPAFTPALAFTLAATVALPTAILVWRDDPTVRTVDVASPPEPTVTVESWHTGPKVVLRGEAEMGQIPESFASTDEAPIAFGQAPAPTPLTWQADAEGLSQGILSPTSAASDALFAPPPSTERYAGEAPGGFLDVADAPVSTFSVDVDTASYARLRRAIRAGQVPAPEMVRTEEVVNAFAYDYPAPTDADMPFRATTTLTDSPWTRGAKLLHIGIKGYDLPDTARPAANLVFLVDTSGSMQDADKLPLLRRSLEMMLAQMDAGDTISIVTYAGSAEVLLEPTPASDETRIRAALARMTAGGGTAGAAGIETAYRLAEEAFVDGGANRVILATDGDFNIGASDPQALERLIAEKRASGVFLTVLGFGTGNLRDDTMQALAQAGNGVAAYVDSLSEARRVLVDGMDAALFTIARDVKLQVEFNPAEVSSYRLIGYETRGLAREDFDDDRVDAGEIGAGHTVTAIYEVVPKGVSVDGPLRYGAAETEAVDQAGKEGELAFLQMRWKAPEVGADDESRLITTPIQADATVAAEALPGDVAFSIAVAAFAEKLRGARGPDRMEWEEIADLARRGAGEDRTGRRRELVELIELTAALSR